MLNYGEAISRQRAAQERRDKRKVSPEIRAARAAVMARMEAAEQERLEAESAAKVVPLQVLRRVLDSADVEDLRDLRARRGSFVLDRMWDLVDEILAERVTAARTKAGSKAAT